MGRARRQGRSATGLAPLVDFQTTRWFGDKFRADNPDVVEQLRRHLPAPTTCRPMGRAAGCWERPTCARPCRAEMPTAIVVGDEDYATPLAMAQALHHGINGSTLTVLPGARHLTPLEAPDRIATELRRLMEVRTRDERSPANSWSRRRATRSSTRARRALLRLLRRGRAGSQRDRPRPLCGDVRDQGRLHEIQVQGLGRDHADRGAAARSRPRSKARRSVSSAA